MTCPKCKSENVNVMVEQTGAKTRKKGMGCLWGIGRFILICCTAGLWLLVSRRKGTDNTTVKNHTVAICQDCGHKWEVSKK